MDALIYHIDDCTRPSSRRLLAIDVCTALVLKKSRAECDRGGSHTCNRSYKKSEQQDEWGGTEEDRCLSATLVEAFRAALIRRLDDPCNVSLAIR